MLDLKKMADAIRTADKDYEEVISWTQRLIDMHHAKLMEAIVAGENAGLTIEYEGLHWSIAEERPLSIAGKARLKVAKITQPV